MKPLGVYSEVGRLDTVLVHQPGWEHRRMIPWNKEAMLCDDILDLESARPEHKGFVRKMRQVGVEVVYFLDLLKEVCADPVAHAEVVEAVTLGGLPAGMSPLQIQPTHLVIGYPEHFTLDESVVLEPTVNLYFTRDPGFFVADKLIISGPCMPIRQRESYLMREVARRHPLFADVEVYDGILEDPGATLEGGDVLVPDTKTVLVGISERTNEAGANMLAAYLFEHTPVEQVVKVFIPKRHEYMHLDTILTFVDRQQIVTLPYIWDNNELYVQVVEKVQRQVERLSAQYSGPPVDIFAKPPHMQVIRKGQAVEDHYDRVLDGLADLGLILPGVTVQVAGRSSRYSSPEEHLLEALREQWNDGANTLALKPGHVITYERNDKTIMALEDVMVEVTTFTGGELVRGRGGARCMSMPLRRDPI